MIENKLIDITTQDKVHVISFTTPAISGISGVEEISRRIRDFIESEQPAKLVVDFNGVMFFSSQMLGLLVDVWKRMEKYQGKMIISGIDPNLSRIFKITNLDKIFKFYPDKQNAVNALND